MVEDEWRQHIVNVLEIANAEWHVMRTQLEGVHQAWEVTNIELRSIGGQLGGINWGLEYLARMVWKRYAASQRGLESGRGRSVRGGATRQEASVGISKGASKEVTEATEGGCKGTEDQGKGPSGLMATDKEKGKEKEAMEEETLQEE